MRYDSKVKFYSESKKHYNPKTSKYEGGAELVLETYANVTDLGLTRQKKLFDSIKIDQLTVRLIESCPKSWAFLTIDNQPKKYKLSKQLNSLKGTAIIIEELSE